VNEREGHFKAAVGWPSNPILTRRIRINQKSE